MGEWSDYFEDFPEENPGNYTEYGVYDPNNRLRDEEKRFNIASNRLNEVLIRKTTNGQNIKNPEAQKKANVELYAMLKKATKETKARSLLVTEDCPQCGLKQLNTYKINDHFYLCECQDCGIYGKGSTHKEALEKTKDALGEDLNWKDNILY